MTSKELENIMTGDEFDPRQTSMNVTMTGKHNKMHIIFTVKPAGQLKCIHWKVIFFSFYSLVSYLIPSSKKSQHAYYTFLGMVGTFNQ